MSRFIYYCFGPYKFPGPTMSLPYLCSEGFCVELLKLGFSADKYFPLGHLSFPRFLSCFSSDEIRFSVHEIRNKSANTFYFQILPNATTVQPIPISQFSILLGVYPSLSEFIPGCTYTVLLPGGVGFSVSLPGVPLSSVRVIRAIYAPVP